MKNNATSNLPWKLTALALCLFFLFACGKRGKPHVPPLAKPGPVRGLRADLQCDGVVLSWLPPKSRNNGGPIKRLNKYLIYRGKEIIVYPDATPTGEPTDSERRDRRSDESTAAKSSGEPGDEEAKTDGSDSPPATDPIRTTYRPILYKTLAKSEWRFDPEEPERLIWEDAFSPEAAGQKEENLSEEESGTEANKPTQGLIYLYRIVPVELFLPEGPAPKTLRVPVGPTPGKPQSMTLKNTEAGIRITWEPPDAMCDGSPPPSLSYRISRAIPDGSFNLIAEDLIENAFMDDAVRDNVSYRYRVEAVVSRPQRAGPGLEAKILYLDKFPPPAPSLLRAIPSAQGVMLVWEPVAAPDLAGYLLYRQGPEGDPVLLFEQPITVHSHLDRGPLPHGLYRYAVVAADSSSSRNESRPTTSKEIRISAAHDAGG